MNWLALIPMFGGVLATVGASREDNSVLRFFNMMIAALAFYAAVTWLAL